jgi:hypothetical protein
VSVEDVSSWRESKRLMLYEVGGGFGLWELPGNLRLDLPDWPEPYEESRRIAREFVEEGWFVPMRTDEDERKPNREISVSEFETDLSGLDAFHRPTPTDSVIWLEPTQKWLDWYQATDW